MKRIVIVIGTVIAVLLGSLFLSMGYIPIIGKYIADYKLSKYCNEKIDSHPCFIYEGYAAKDSDGKELKYYPNKNTIFDSIYATELDKHYNAQYLAYVESLEETKVEYPESIDTYTEISASDYDRTYTICDFTVYEDNELSEEESKEHMIAILKGIIENVDMNCTYIRMSYGNRNGQFVIKHKLKNDESYYDKLMKSIKQYTVEEWSVNYKHWRETH